MNSTKANEVKKTDEDVQEKQELSDEEIEGVVGGMQEASFSNFCDDRYHVPSM